MPFITVLDSTGTAQSLSVATITGGKLNQVQIYDGTNVATIKAASTAAAATDAALVVTLSPNLPSGTASISIQGTAAIAASMVGNPLQVGGVFQTTPATLTNGQQGALQTDPGQNLLTRIRQIDPPGVGNNTQTPVVACTSGGAQINAATLAAVSSVTNYLSGFEITGAGATGASVVTVTVSGILGGSLIYYIPVPAGANVAITPLVVEFNPPLPASSTDTAISVSAASFGSGNTSASVVAHGFHQ